MAPIAFFAFNRPVHAARSLEALASNPEAAASDLFVFVDGPRNPSEADTVAAVVEVARAAKGFRSVSVVAAAANKGLFRSITEGVSAVLRDSERVIVIEDDVVVAPSFLAYVNEALSKYAAEPKVACIHGYTPPIDGLPDYFFLQGGDCWGWATWKDRWALFNPDAGELVRQLRDTRLAAAFIDTYGARSLLMLVRRALGKNQSWALPWSASLFLAGRLTLHPGRSFVTNIGNDGSGAHASASGHYDSQLRGEYHGLPELPIVHDAKAARSYARYYDCGPQPGRATLWLRLPLRLYARAMARYAASRSRPGGTA